MGGKPIPSDGKVHELLGRAIAAEGEDFDAAMADLRLAIQHACQGLENVTLASSMKVSKVVEISEAASVAKGGKKPRKRAA